jgi:sugar lactone lactonase YvrE
MPRIVLAALAALVVTTGHARADKVLLVAGNAQTKVVSPFGVDFDQDGNMYFVEMTNNRFGRIDTKGKLTILAGDGAKGDSGDGGPAAKATLNGPHSLAVGQDGAVYLADTFNNRIRRYVPQTGNISGFAGSGEKGFAGDGGPAATAKFGGVYCIAFDPKGERLYVADLDNRRIRAIEMKSGTVTTVAGNGSKGVPQDGAVATEAPLVDPRAVAVDGQGNVYILERAGNALRVVDSSGKIRTVAGTGEKGAAGDGGDARKATLNGPKHLDIDREGNVLIADTENHLIRKYIASSGQIVRVAGTGTKGTGGLGGPPDQVELSQPHGVCAHPGGDIFIADSSNNRILRIVK